VNESWGMWMKVVDVIIIHVHFNESKWMKYLCNMIQLTIMDENLSSRLLAQVVALLSFH
jgi:hypothetical protein